MTTQFTTFEEAQRIAKEVGAIGGGVLPFQAEDPERSGIYIAEYYGPFATPEDGERKFYHFRFRNGAEGFNAGLVKRTMEYAPTRWPLMLATEVNAAANAARAAELAG
jgi:hypothetical protein